MHWVGWEYDQVKKERQGYLIWSDDLPMTSISIMQEVFCGIIHSYAGEEDFVWSYIEIYSLGN